jgi:hypothetical protein
MTRRHETHGANEDEPRARWRLCHREIVALRASVRNGWKADIWLYSFAGVHRAVIIVGLTVAALITGCTQPTHDHATLAAIKAESLALMQAHPAKMDHPLPKGEWPPFIASLEPTFVSVDQAGVNIMVKPDFDGGYGYYVLKKGQGLPGPPEMYSRLDEGIYWYRPY